MPCSRIRFDTNFVIILDRIHCAIQPIVHTWHPFRHSDCVSRDGTDPSCVSLLMLFVILATTAFALHENSNILSAGPNRTKLLISTWTFIKSRAVQSTFAAAECLLEPRNRTNVLPFQNEVRLASNEKQRNEWWILCQTLRHYFGRQNLYKIHEKHCCELRILPTTSLWLTT